jgi:hypothetical protein
MRYPIIFLIALVYLTGCISLISYENEKTDRDNKTIVELEGIREFITPLPDGIPVFDNGKEYILTDPTKEYRHGVLGDAIEAKSLTIIEGDDVRKIDFSPQVFEGLYPLLVDFDGDNEKELIATLSGNGAGAQLVVYDTEGNVISSSDPLSSGWRHALAVAPFGPNGELELADVSRPHVEMEVEFFQLNYDKLVKVAGIRSYSTHIIGSRNLELFAVLEENGRYLLIVPTPDFRSIAAIGRAESGAEEFWRREINEKIHSISAEDNIVLVNGKQVS